MGSEGCKENHEVDLSIVMPVFNEEENLGPLIEEIEHILKPMGKAWEILCVDDCSTDRSLEVLRSLQPARPYLRIVRHRQNCGESAAEATGFHHSLGKIIITIDADQQNDPADIPLLLGALEQGIAAVCGVRRKREDDWIKRISSRIANGFRNWITGDRIADAGCTYRALRRDALLEIPVFNGLHRFLPTILRLQGLRVIEIPVNHRPRVHGVSKYGVGNRMWRGILDCLAMRWYRARSLPSQRVAYSDPEKNE